MSHPNQDPKRIRRRRIAAGLSVTDLAEKASVTKSHLSDVENGRSGFGPARLARVATALGCSVEDLMPAEDEAGPDR